MFIGGGQYRLHCFSVFGQARAQPDAAELPVVQRPAVQLQLRSSVSGTTSARRSIGRRETTVTRHRGAASATSERLTQRPTKWSAFVLIAVHRGPRKMRRRLRDVRAVAVTNQRSGQSAHWVIPMRGVTTTSESAYRLARANQQRRRLQRPPVVTRHRSRARGTVSPGHS